MVTSEPCKNPKFKDAWAQGAYHEALEELALAEEAWALAPPDTLALCDNPGLLQLDTVWCPPPALRIASSLTLPWNGAPECLDAFWDTLAWTLQWVWHASLLSSVQHSAP